MDECAWEQLQPWSAVRLELPASRPCSSPLKKMKRTLFVGWTRSAMICSAVSSTTPDCLMTQFDAERELAVAVRDMRPPIAAKRT